jgi:hypothetical protein
MATLTAKMLLEIRIDYALSRDLASTSHPIQLNRGLTLTNGTGANKGDVCYDDTITIADGASDSTIVLNDGTMTDSHGTAITMDILRGMYIKNNSTDAGLIIGAAAATQLAIFGTPATDTLLLPPGGEFFWTAPDATGLDVTTNDTLKLEHNGVGTSSMNVDVIIIGED